MSNILTSTIVTREVDGKNFLMETGKLANQADGNILIKSGDTVVLVTAVTQPLERDIDFMPLVVDYQEMSYASGKIPGSYFRREIGRPSERETLVSRLIDRPIRPLFPKGFRQEVQILATVLSADPNYDPDVLAITGASSALHISNIPFQGPIAGARVGYLNNKFIFNPTQDELEESLLNLIVASSKEAVVMVEGDAKFADEELVSEAISWGHEKIKPLLEQQEEIQDKIGKTKIQVLTSPIDDNLADRIRELSYQPLEEALNISQKIERNQAIKQIKEQVNQSLAIEYPDTDISKAINETLEETENEIVRSKIRTEKSRIDGRDLNTVRDIGIEVGLLPRVHGSSLFARGETKALGVVTLGGTQDEQHVETLSGEQSKRFMLHYNFPPYCVGEVKMLRGPSRREIGHGALAERSIFPVLPESEEFPFTIRLVSEIMESNGSSSMATVCASSLALMDAGVPIKAPVAGIAMGLIKEEDDYYILTDILGDEDHLGDMDFKIAGTQEGITGIQMDIKISGIPSDIIRKALFQAREARLHVLDNMNKVLAQPRQNLSEHAPQLKVIEVDPDRVKDIIGPAGKNIKAITKATNASIDIEDNGKITIFAPNHDVLQETIRMVLFYNQKAQVGETYAGKVKSVKDFGAIVEILPGVEGLVHISQLDVGRINNIYDFLKIGDEIKVKVIEIEENTGRIRLSRKALLTDDQKKRSSKPEASGNKNNLKRSSAQNSSKKVNQKPPFKKNSGNSKD